MAKVMTLNLRPSIPCSEEKWKDTVLDFLYALMAVNLAVLAFKCSANDAALRAPDNEESQNKIAVVLEEFPLPIAIDKVTEE